jgi:probable rRNA maturation factor
LGCTDAELSVVIVDDEEMTGLNRQYRGLEATTDVLAFAMQEGEFGDITPELLGDVVISAPTAAVMSREHGVARETVLDLLLVHGVLHLVGHDHELGAEEAQAMDVKTLDLMRLLGHQQKDLDWYLTAGE